MTRVFAVDGDVLQVVDGARVFDIRRDVPEAAGLDAPHVPPPPGEVLARIATISDLHVGERGFGILPHVAERPRRHREHFTVRAARAAIAEAAAWGAELVVVKGDITWSGAPVQWEKACEVFASSPVPVCAMLGNHDTIPTAQAGRPWLEDAGVSVVVDGDQPAAHVDVAGMRVVLVHTASHGHRIAHLDAATRDGAVARVEAAPAGAGVVVMVHHHPDRLRWPSRYPLGIAARDARAFFASLARLPCPPALVTCGHTHRHRRYRRNGITVSEVGSTKDYPGVWAGYAVHTGGIRQVVRRIAEPSVVEWTERTRRSCLGLWGEWTPGRLDWRCFSLPWSGGR